jgi:hypothetical protein
MCIFSERGDTIPGKIYTIFDLGARYTGLPGRPGPSAGLLGALGVSDLQVSTGAQAQKAQLASP